MSRTVNLRLSLPFSSFLSTYNPMQQEPDFFLRLLFHYKHERFHRDQEGRVTLTDTYSILPSTSSTCHISPRVLASPSLCSLHLTNFLRSFNDLDTQLRTFLIQRIAPFLNDSANRQLPFLGYYVLADVEIIQEEWVFDRPETILTTAMMVDNSYIFHDAGGEHGESEGSSRLAIEKLKEKGGFYYKKESEAAGNGGGEISSGCSICLEDFSGAVRLLKMPCSHIFHEDCIFKWLRNRNSCPLCRSEVEI